MQIIINAEPKEIADLIDKLRDRLLNSELEFEIDSKKLCDSIKEYISYRTQ